MKLAARAFNPSDLEPYTRSGYPEPFRTRVIPREKLELGDASGLTKIGINLTTLAPGKVSSMRHWHTHEDELVYIVSGELVLITDAGEESLREGQCVGFPAGNANAHQLANRSARPVTYLEISNRDAEDVVHYPDVDLRWNAPGARGKYTHKDGRPY